MTIVRAVYENQALRLEAPLTILEGAVVEVSLNIPDQNPPLPRKRFTWEDGPILPGDVTNSLTDELRRQRDARTPDVPFQRSIR